MSVPFVYPRHRESIPASRRVYPGEPHQPPTETGIVPPRQRSFWNLTRTFAAVFLPLGLVATLVAVGLGIDAATAFSGFALFSALALAAAMVTANRFARRVADSLTAARNVESSCSL